MEAKTRGTILKALTQLTLKPVALEAATKESALTIVTSEGYFFTFKGNGEMRVEQNQKYEEGSYSIAKLTKWTILDARKVTNRDKVTPFNDICLKSPFGHYF